MKTNITITYSPAAVMTLAWSIRKNAAARFGCKVSEISMAHCLRDAWAIVKAGSIVRHEYNQTDAAALDRWVRNCCHKYAKIEIGKTVADHYNRRLEQPAFDWYGYAEQHLDDMADEAWCYLLKRIDDHDWLAAFEAKGKGLRELVYNAAQSGVSKIIRAESKHAMVTHFDRENAAGDSFSILDIFNGESTTCHTSAIAADAELSALVVAFAATLDDKNRKVFGLRLQGMTERDIAAEMKVSGPAIHKRLTKIKAALVEYLAA